jgi:transcription initiation factor TFIID subunit 3
MDNPFYFSLARISTAQILRAAGLDRTRPSTLDVLSDIMVRYLILLGSQTSFFANVCSRPEANIRDVTLALENVGMLVRGTLVSRKRLSRIVAVRKGEEVDSEGSDPEGEDEDDESTQSLERLLAWFRGPQAAECRRVAGVLGADVNGITPSATGVDNHRPSYVAEYVGCMDFYAGGTDGSVDTKGIG